MRKSRKESIKNDLSSFIIWLTECLEPKSYNEDDDLDNINLNDIWRLQFEDKKENKTKK